MNQKSIRLYAHEVRGVLDGRQSQLRRIIKPQPVKKSCGPFGGAAGLHPNDWEWFHKGRPGVSTISCKPNGPEGWAKDNSPFGQPGDVLWAKETWALTTNINYQDNWPNRPHVLHEAYNGQPYYATIYRADGYWQWTDDDGFSTEKSYWKPSIHMPKSACRIFLRITDIRVERLQDITEMDAFAEGIDDQGDSYIEAEQAQLAGVRVCAGSPAQHSFANLWMQINGPDSWAANPWVWVVSFERIDKPEQIPEKSPS